MNDNNKSFFNTKMFKDKRVSGEYHRNITDNSQFRNSVSLNNSDEDFVISSKRPRTCDSTNSSISSKTETDTIPCSPWEWRKMKSEIISLKSRLSHQEATVQQLHKVRKEMEDVFQNEKKVLEIQIEQDQEMIRQLELRVDVGRRALQDAKRDQLRAEQSISQIKSKFEKKILALTDENAKLSEKILTLEREDKKDKIDTPIEDNFKEVQDQIEIASKRISELEENLKEARLVQQNFELQTVELQNLKIKFENLESEKALWEEGKYFTARAGKATELEKELHQAKEIIASLRESVKGKLLLEEQLAVMEHKIAEADRLEKQIIQLELKKSDLQMIISDYESIGIHGGPSGVRKELRRLQHSETMLTDETGQLRSQIDTLKREYSSLQQKLEEVMKSEKDKISSIDRMTRLINRLQKKIMITSRERDTYKDQADLFEKELSSEAPNPESISAGRVPALERIVEGYKDLVARLENDVEMLDGGSLKDENKKLIEENEKLKDEIAHRALKGDFNINSRILHFKMNPAAIAEQQAQEKQKAMIKELEDLRNIVSSGMKTSSSIVSPLVSQEIAELQQKHEVKITRLKEAFRASSHEYRQAIYQLFGWRVDRTKDGEYKLSSQYADSPDDYLFFIVNDDGVNLIETPFSETLTPFIQRHLQIQHSVPMFLMAVQTDLFEQQTMTNIVN